jgi:type VI secretion system protein ImpJ
MSMQDKVIWSEGMFLQPQHFQQHDRYLENLITQRPGALESYQWGIIDLKIDQQLLALGKFAITFARGILPDGTAFDIPARDKAPAPIDIPVNTTDCKIFLATPLKRAGVPETGYTESEQLLRYHIETIEVSDNNADSDLNTPVQIGKLALRLLLENEDRQGYSCLSLARILEVRRDDHHITLDEQFLSPCMTVHAVAPLTSLLQEIQSLLRYRGEALVQRLTEAGTGGVAEITDFMLLQLINRLEPLFIHLTAHRSLHPVDLYRLLIQLAGELATFTRQQRRFLMPPNYLHDNLQDTFTPLIAELRRALSIVLEENAVLLKLEQQQSGTWVATLTDKSLLEKATFVLAVAINAPQEQVRQHFPAQTKIAPVEEIRNLVNRGLPGIALNSLSVAPRQIPYHANFTYFALNNSHPLWRQLAQSAGIAFHVGGNFPGLRLELWAVKDK